MDYKNLWFKTLQEQLDYDYKQYKNFKISKKDTILLDKSYKHVKIIIKNNKIINKKLENTPIRLKKVIEVFTLAISYSNKYNLPKITGEFYVRLSDGYDSNYNYPTMNYAKPRNKNGFLIPDFNFLDFNDKIKKFDQKCGKSKKNLIYFKGSSTSIKQTKVREKMSLLNKPFKVSISEKYEPYYNLCYYKYVLDLSGFKPWSVRLIELYMSRSLPIRIIFYKGEWNEKQWIQFYERIFPAWVSYIPIEYDLDYNKEISDDIIKDIESKCLKVLKFFNKHQDFYNKITNDNFLKVKALTKEHVGFYFYYCCINYLKVVS
jgi:hypothetical protein